MASGFTFKSGPWELDTIATPASTLLSVGDFIKINSGVAALFTTGSKNLGALLSGKVAADAATTAVQYIRALPHRTKFFATTKNGTLSATTSLKTTFRAYTAGASATQGIDQAATTVCDLYVHKVLSTGTAGTAIVMCVNPADIDSVVV